MKTIAVVLLLAAFAALAEMPYHPYRIVTIVGGLDPDQPGIPPGTNIQYADLERLYQQWQTNSLEFRNPYRQGQGDWFFHSGIVESNVGDGLIMNSRVGSKFPERFLLKNYPGWEKLTNGVEIEFFAMAVPGKGYFAPKVTWRTNGDQVTLSYSNRIDRSFKGLRITTLDYGVPCDLKDLPSKEKQPPNR